MRQPHGRRTVDARRRDGPGIRDASSGTGGRRCARAAYRRVTRAAPVLPLLRQAAKQGLIVLADLGYEGAGAGVRVPVKRPGSINPERLSADNKTANLLLRGIRAIGERAMALLVGRWRLLRHTTKSPSRIGDLVKAALVLHHLEKQTR
ncbi:hypothetical protein F4561_000351 [Lipingzhangella halophila]|uniref:DDE Tnp4 domain-containing protein n=1 Tax=Lipingzhangella halophila TaxID=1783352 RepID=A0A7W7RDR4_9ACTN|nr:transposase family protein [Lipingzhangella halophila]MBB4929531.1 hypothetical protein [Lipingzhangella halophila]